MSKLTRSNKILKKSLLQLNTSIYSTQYCLGCIIAPMLFAKGKRALLIDESQKRAFVFANNQNEAYFSIMLLTELITVIGEMKKQGVIIDAEIKQTDLELFYSTEVNELMDDSIPGRYKTTNGGVLEYSSKPQLKEDDILLTGYVIPSQLFAPLKETLLSISFPTPHYSDYINHGFCTEDAFRTKRAFRVSWFAIIVAILIGVLSPFGSILLGNLFGHMTLDNGQFQKLITVIRDND